MTDTAANSANLQSSTGPFRQLIDASRARRSSRGVGDAGWGRTLFAAIVSIIYFFPVFWIILTSFKTYEDALAVPAKFFFTPTLDNFAQVFSRAYSSAARRRTPASPSISSTRFSSPGVSVLLALAIGTMAAFGFSRYPLKGNDTYSS